ncbi:MAG TPA: mannitol dehydrogenase family protein, partial [Burkholderiaceae bacterium]|nr:mannitol dehydrogenase family protein [Burkholderiaceae bacterium]
AGWPTVDAAMAQPALARFVDALMREEIAPTLADSLPGADLDGYRLELLARFANPALAHRTVQIAMDGSQKLPQRLLATVRDRIAAGQPVARLAFAVAAWLQHLRGLDEAGRPFKIDDPLAPQLAALQREAAAHDGNRARAAAYSAFAPVFGDLGAQPAWVDALAHALGSLRERGVVASLERYA